MSKRRTGRTHLFERARSSKSTACSEGFASRTWKVGKLHRSRHQSSPTIITTPPLIRESHDPSACLRPCDDLTYFMKYPQAKFTSITVQAIQSPFHQLVELLEITVFNRRSSQQLSSNNLGCGFQRAPDNDGAVVKKYQTAHINMTISGTSTTSPKSSIQM